jgi:hypothetical protein
MATPSAVALRNKPLRDTAADSGLTVQAILQYNIDASLHARAPREPG